ncbi:MAG TPA: OmpA family protein [Cyclobacteriaceae bacterium]|nr:OmpA family protein [Cyclobacteriaceae bacterium]
MKRLIIIGVFMVYSCVALSQGNQEELRKSIYFNGGSYYIDEEQVLMLSDWLDSIPNLLDKYQIQLISHTDPIGGKEFNEWLSKMRSQSVMEVLIWKDIPEKFISIKDWGLENPVYQNDNRLGMRMNRRVDVILHPLVF